MGCTSSVFYPKKTCTHFNTGLVKSRVIYNVKRPVELTAAEIDIVQRTWPALARDLHGNGLQVFLRIFELCPEAKILFSVENVRHSELARNVTIKAHGARFLNAINAAVENLNKTDQKDDDFCRLLFFLGQQHKHFKGFRPEYFEIFYEALMWQWGRCMGEKFTPEVSDTWSHVFVYIMEKLKEGYFSNDEMIDTNKLDSLK